MDSKGTPRLWTSQKDLGAAVGVTESQVAKWEKGEIPDEWKYIQPICEFLGCAPEDLLGRDDREQYTYLEIRYNEALLHSEDSLEIARLSRQVLAWKKFFEFGSFFDADDEPSEVDKDIDTLTPF